MEKAKRDIFSSGDIAVSGIGISIIFAAARKTRLPMALGVDLGRHRCLRCLALRWHRTAGRCARIAVES
jgi:hypothetical protein